MVNLTNVKPFLWRVFSPTGPVSVICLDKSTAAQSWATHGLAAGMMWATHANKPHRRSRFLVGTIPLKNLISSKGRKNLGSLIGRKGNLQVTAHGPLDLNPGPNPINRLTTLGFVPGQLETKCLPQQETLEKTKWPKPFLVGQQFWYQVQKFHVAAAWQRQGQVWPRCKIARSLKMEGHQPPVLELAVWLAV